jgi:hypothetical protein
VEGAELVSKSQVALVLELGLKLDVLLDFAWDMVLQLDKASG